MRRLVLIAAAAMAAVLATAGVQNAPTGSARAQAAQVGTPVADRDAPAPADCRGAPRAYDTFVLLATPGPVSSPPPVPSGAPGGLPAGEPADPATVAGITATIREVLACRNAGDLLRSLALYSDPFLRPLLAASGPLPPAAYARFATPQAIGPESWVALLAIHDARLLVDGRAGAVVVVDDPTAASGPRITADFLVFVRAGDRWLLDATIEGMAIAPAGTPAAGTPAAASGGRTG